MFAPVSRANRRPPIARIAFVTPAWLGGTSWNFCEGWIRAARQTGVAADFFHVDADESSIKRLFSRLSRCDWDFVMLLCGDHHLCHLHNAEPKREYWRKLKMPVVCLNNEGIIDSPFPNALTDSLSAIASFDAFLYVDELADHVYAATGKPAMWVTQFTDHTLFKPRKQFAHRSERVYFRAQLSNFGMPDVYSERLALIAAINEHRAFDIHRSLLPAPKLAKELGVHRFLLRTPSNCPGYVEAVFNGMAAGCAVLHQKLPLQQARSRALLIPGKHFVEYDLTDPEALIAKAKEMQKNWGDYQAVAEAGREVVLQNFTIERSLNKVIDFVSGQALSK